MYNIVFQESGLLPRERMVAEGAVIKNYFLFFCERGTNQRMFMKFLRTF